jgi:tRNA(His) 5'-end guanylyltransferase
MSLWTMRVFQGRLQQAQHLLRLSSQISQECLGLLYREFDISLNRDGEGDVE